MRVFIGLKVLQITLLNFRLQTTSVELELMDSIIHESGGNNISFSETRFDQNNFKNPGSNSSTPMNQEDRLTRLKDELYKSINNIKVKREEIKILEKQLQEKNQEIKEIKNDENKALVDLSLCKDNCVNLQSKLKILENELNKQRSQNNRRSDENEKSESNIEKYEDKISELESRNSELSENFAKMQRDYEELDSQYKEFLFAEKQLREKIECLQTQNAEMERQMNREQNESKELVQEREKVCALERALKMNELKCDELIKTLELEKCEKQKRLSEIKGNLLLK